MATGLRLHIFGAAETVTGSKYLLEAGTHRVLVDCGLFQGAKELRLRNWQDPPFDPRQLSAVVLTHAHIDHTGYLPLLVRRGFNGPVYCTPATYELLQLLLPDSAHMQEEEAKFANRHGTSKHKPAKPLYTLEDAQAALKLLVTFERNSVTEIKPQLFLSGTQAGHILGSVSVSLEYRGKRVTISGDLGRYGAPLLPDPAPAELGDVLLCESTYGDRRHPDTDIRRQLAHVVQEAASRRGPVIIPAFAIGRTQTLLYYLAELELAEEIPRLPVYVDSPMAVDATQIYRNHRFDYDDEAAALLEAGMPPLRTAQTVLCRSVDESKRLNELTGARIVISASGMATGGRILHHLRHWAGKEETTILFVGYQAEGTRGRIIQSGAESVKIFGEYVPIRAAVETIGGLSAHADQGELLRWLRSCRGSPAQVRMIHGEKEAAHSFAHTVSQELGWRASAAPHGEIIEV